jgi:DNA polymerase
MSAIRQDLEINESIPTLRGKYVKVPYDEAIARLYEEIITVQPRMILTVGATPMWAVTGKDKITEGRGFTTMTIAGKEFPVMSTFHPAGILRRREWYDLFKSDIKQAVENANRLC